MSSRPSNMRRMSALSSALDQFEAILDRIGDRGLAVLLDYDGTLTPIVPRPMDAVLEQPMRTTLTALARHCFVGIVSGRDTNVLHQLMGVEGLAIAGDHGLVIETPQGPAPTVAELEAFPPLLDKIQSTLLATLEPIAGAQVERKRFSIAVHYRRVSEEQAPTVVSAAEQIAADHPELRLQRGKMVVELVPDVPANKGTAVKQLLAVANEDGAPLALYIGDDITDEDAFRAIAVESDGIGIVVLGEGNDRTSLADYSLTDCDQVRSLLARLSEEIERRGK